MIVVPLQGIGNCYHHLYCLPIQHSFSVYTDFESREVRSRLVTWWHQNIISMRTWWCHRCRSFQKACNPSISCWQKFAELATLRHAIWPTKYLGWDLYSLSAWWNGRFCFVQPWDMWHTHGSQVTMFSRVMPIRVSLGQSKAVHASSTMKSGSQHLCHRYSNPANCSTVWLTVQRFIIIHQEDSCVAGRKQNARSSPQTFYGTSSPSKLLDRILVEFLTCCAGEAVRLVCI